MMFLQVLSLRFSKARKLQVCGIFLMCSGKGSATSGKMRPVNMRSSETIDRGNHDRIVLIVSCINPQPECHHDNS